MSHNKSWETLTATLLVIAVIVLSTLRASAAAEYRTLHRFTFGGKDGNYPRAGLVLDSAGNLYGTTAYGGAHGSGCVFKLTPSASGKWTESRLYNFTGRQDGGNPFAGLVFDRAGNLYGTTSGGGAGFGVVFEITPTSDGIWKEKVLHSFTGGDGSSPVDGLIFDGAGNLYGTTSAGGGNCGDGCGVVFELTQNADGSWSESVLYSFTYGNNGCLPRGGLISDPAGNLYGTTWACGVYDEGTVFELTPSAGGSWTEAVLYAFESVGEAPVAGLIFDAEGNLYGTTPLLIGDSGFGTAFELVPHSDGTWTESTLYRFCQLEGCPDGANPAAGLTFDQAGNLYGTTLSGGYDDTNCCGVVFKLTPTSGGGWKETVVHVFADHPGAFPYAGLILDSAGNLYGTTSGDGRTTFGSVFEITP